MHTRERQRESTNSGTEESRQFFNIVQAMDETEREQVLKVGEILCSIEKLTKENFHLPDKEFAEIMNGTSKVDHVVLRSRSRKLRKWMAEAVIVLLLSVMMSVSGIADSMRTIVLRFFQNPLATSVSIINYDKAEDLMGCMLPSTLPVGYSYTSHTRSSGGTLFVLYEDDAGNSIQYFCYPKNAVASYDNEFTSKTQFTFDRGTAYVEKSVEGMTTMYLLMDERFIQMDFSGEMNEAELKQVANGLKILK